METTEKTLLNWQQFKKQLSNHPDLDLQFQYAAKQLVDAPYHITEIKQAPVVSVDCGGKMNNWTEIIVQLWEPVGKQQERPMKVRKALSIIELVEKAMPLNVLGIVKIEFGNSQFDTRQMYPNEIFVNGGNLIVDLRPDFTQCKALGRGDTCGKETENHKSGLQNLASCCTPESGCC